MARLIGIGGELRQVGLLLIAGLALASCANVTGASVTQRADAARDQGSQSLVRLGDAARQTNDLAGAVKLYRNALIESPDQVDVLLVLGGTLFQGGDHAEAIESYNKVLTLAPQRPDAHLGLGRVYLAEYKPNQARVEFTAALQADPRNVQAFNDQGVALDMLGQHFDAQQSYMKGLAFAPDNTALRNNLGLSLAISGNYDQAVVELSNLSLEPGSIPRNRENLALALGLKGDTQGAAKLLRADLDEQTVSGDLQYFAAVRRLAQSAPEQNPPQNPPKIAAPASFAVPAAIIAAANPLSDVRTGPAPQTKTLPQRIEMASVAPQNHPADELARLPVPVAKSIYIETGAYSVMDNATRVADRLKSLGARIFTITRQGRPLYCVQIGPAQDMKDAAKMIGDVRNLGHDDARIVVE
jgi:Flp pilus assembly protein TadD